MSSCLEGAESTKGNSFLALTLRIMPDLHAERASSRCIRKFFSGRTFEIWDTTLVVWYFASRVRLKAMGGTDFPFLKELKRASVQQGLSAKCYMAP